MGKACNPQSILISCVLAESCPHICYFNLDGSYQPAKRVQAAERRDTPLFLDTQLGVPRCTL